MKRLILCAAIALLCAGVKAQDTIPKINGKYQITEVVAVDSTLTKQDLYNNSKLYFVDSYTSAKDVIQFDDKDAGRIVGKGFFELTDSQFVLPWVWDVYYTTEIIVKNGKYKYRIYDINIKQYMGNGRMESDFDIEGAKAQLHKQGYKKETPKLLKGMNEKFWLTVEDLKSRMHANNTANNNF